MNTISLSRQKKILQKIKRLNMDPAEFLAFTKNTDSWQSVRGILPKKISGLKFQKTIRKEWV